MAMREITDCVPPDWELRGVQEEILKTFREGLDQGKEYFFVNAPTGSGKSLVNLTISRYLEDAYIMTPLKHLQRQYMEDFSSLLVEVKGRSNYICPDGKPCHKAMCVEKQISPFVFRNECGHCPWVEILELGEASDCTLFNFYSYLCQTRFARRFTEQRGALIIDEAHNLIETLRNLFDIRIKIDSLEARAIELPANIRNISQLTEWAEQTGISKAQKLARLSPEDDDSNRFRDLLFKLQSLTDNPENYILGKSKNSYIVRTKKVGDFFLNHLAPYGAIKIFSSATLLNPKVTCDYLSIPWNKVAYISLPWPMTVEQGPISLDLAALPITYRSLKKRDTLEHLAEALLIILDKLHPKDRGVVHCVSYALKDQLMELLPRRIRSRLTDNLSDFKRKPGKVLIGPSFYEGLDLKDDLCRFQVLLKVPLPSISDPLVGYLGFDHPEIKQRVVTSMAQAYGRGLRHSEDYCTFYILDRKIHNWKGLLPEYMRRAIL